MRAADIDVKSVWQRILAQMPLAHRGSLVAGVFQLVCPGSDLRIQRVGSADMLQPPMGCLATRLCAHVEDLVPWGVLAGEQTGTGGSAVRRAGVGIGKGHSLRRKAIEIR